MPTITNRDPWDTWMAAGGKSMRQYANERACKILAAAGDELLPVTLEQEKEIEAICRSGIRAAIERASEAAR